MIRLRPPAFLLMLLLGLASCDTQQTTSDRNDSSPATQPATSAPAGVSQVVATPVATPLPEGYEGEGLSIQPVSDLRQKVPGPWAQGDFGDWRIATKGVTAIISGTHRDEATNPPAVGIIDLAQAENAYDELGQIEPVFYVGDDPVAMKYNASRVVKEGAPALEFSGSTTSNKTLEVRTTYEADEDPRAIRVTTTVTNNTTETLYNVGIGDRVQWGVYAPFVDSFGIPDPAKLEITRSGWIGGRIDENSLGIVIEEGEIEAAHLGSNTNTRYNNVHVFERGQSVSATRMIFLGGEDFSEFTDYALASRNTPHTEVTGRVLEVDTGIIVAGAKVRIDTYIKTLSPDRRSADATPTLPFTLTISGDDGRFSFQAPIGRRVVPNIHEVSRQGQPFALIYETVEGKTLDVGDVLCRAETRLAISVLDDETSRPLPSKVQINQVSGAVVNYGPPYEAQGFRNFYYVPSGRASIPVPHQGNYDVLISRGPEYTVEKLSLQPVSGQVTTETVRLRRVMDTSGYLSLDPGVYTEASPVSRVTATDMAMAAAGEGVEWLVSADVNKATDLKPAIREAGLDGWLGATTGMRPTPVGQPFGGNFTVFPVDPDNAFDALEAPYLKNSQPAEVLRGIRKAFPESLLMVNTPVELTGGYFRAHGFKGQSLPTEIPSFNYDFDLLGVLDGRLYHYRQIALQYISRMGQLGRFYTPAAASSSLEFFGNEPGYPRMYVQVPEDDPAKATEAQIIDSLRKGRVVVSNGPFIRFTSQGKTLGELVQAKDQKLNVEVEVWAAPWMNLTDVQIYKDNQWHQTMMRMPSEEPLRFPMKSIDETNPLRLEVKDDVTLQVLALGNIGPAPVVSSIEGRKASDVPVFAMTGPIFVDGNGDGKFDPAPDGQPRY